MKADEFLTTALETLVQRGKTYDKDPNGTVERSMGRAVRAFAVITGKEITPAEGYLLLQLLKDVRQWSKTDFHFDSALDSIAYAALKAEALADG